MKDDFIHMGMREGYGRWLPFGLAPADLRHHLYIIGQTGAGKTTLVRNLMLQLIAHGHGVAFIDAHGDEAERLLDCLPRQRTRDVTHFNPSDLEYPTAMNLLANVPKDERPLVASGIVGAFKSLWPDSWGPRMEYILYNAIIALLDCRNVSLLGVNRLLTDDEYRAWVIRQIEDPFIQDFWQNEYAGYDDRFRREAIAPIQNKLGQFLLNPVVRNILGQADCRVNFSDIMDNRQIFIANLSKGKIGHDKANLLGSLLVTQFQLAAMRRSNQPEHERRDFYLFIDEFQNFTTDSFASILSEARKYRLCLVLSHQYIEQVPRPIQQAMFGNVGTMLAFRVGYTDAEILAKQYAHVFTARQFVDLERFGVLARLMVNGAQGEPFKGMTHPPAELKTGRAPVHVAQSRQKSAVPRAVVEAKLNRLIARNAAEPHHYKKRTHKTRRAR